MALMQKTLNHLCEWIYRYQTEQCITINLTTFSLINSAFDFIQLSEPAHHERTADRLCKFNVILEDWNHRYGINEAAFVLVSIFNLHNLHSSWSVVKSPLFPLHYSYAAALKNK